jgi:hypothetical protein
LLLQNPPVVKRERSASANGKKLLRYECTSLKKGQYLLLGGIGITERRDLQDHELPEVGEK